MNQKLISIALLGLALRVVGFADYGSGLGSAGQVYGTPALVRGKRDSGFGFGAGIHAETNFGLIRLEAGLAPNEKPVLYLNLGDRF